MTREEQVDWLCRLRADLNNGIIFTPWNKEFNEALTGILEQEPCDDEYIKVPKKALKYRTAGMVAYNTEWLKNHFDIERTVICGAQEPSSDAISRQAVRDTIFAECSGTKLDIDFAKVLLLQRAIKTLPSVTPQPKTGRWIRVDKDKCKCDQCEVISFIGVYPNGDKNYCPNCGAKMVEPQERSKE